MQFVKDRFNYLFGSTKGLILVAIAMVGIVTAIWGMLSGPMAEMGVREAVIKTLGMDIVQAEREGRIVILYHSIAMAIIAIETYMITSLLKMKAFFKTAINVIITAGYILTLTFGLVFAYFGHNWIFHGVYLFGLSLIFFAGLLLIVALWPWNPETYITDKDYARTKKGVDMERVAFFATAVTTVISALFGAVPGSYYGHGFETTIVLNLGVWGVVTPLEPVAHMIIYVGATPSMFAALLLLIWNWSKLIREGTAHLQKSNFIQKLGALVRDPLKFGPTWQMLFMNFTTSGIGIFMAIKLDEIFRVWPAREERIELTGHWHALSAIIATIILLYYGDMIGLKGKVRRLYGWAILILSDIALAAVTIFEMKRLFIAEAVQQPLVNGLMLGIDFGLGLLLVLLATVMVWRLIDLFKPKGRWAEEVTHELAQEVMK
ncbi:MAG: hypothetical protein HZB19_01955 [Chloroflexi bacterium]|nr:hypothetical protein [Chloroflexota bacterium]